MASFNKIFVTIKDTVDCCLIILQTNATRHISSVSLAIPEKIYLIMHMKCQNITIIQIKKHQ